MSSEQRDSQVFAVLSWIVLILQEENITYQIVGGFAARLHGRSRPIVDIDMYIPAESAPSLTHRVREFITKPLRRYVEDVWDIEYFQIIYQGQKIEFGLSSGVRIFDKRSGLWIDQKIDFTTSVGKDFQGLPLRVMSVHALIGYKTILNREVDRVDIAQVEEANDTTSNPS